MITVRKQTELYVWNVGDGASIYAKTPNSKSTIIDCGGAPNVFSPIEHVRNELKVQEIDYLIISHPHNDHIKDLSGIERHYGGYARVLRRNRDITEDLMIRSNEDLRNDEYLRKYFELVKRHPNPVGDNNPQKPNWGAGCELKCFNNTYVENGDVTNSTINDLSVVTFIQFGNDIVLYGGDVEESGWEKILNMSGFKELLVVVHPVFG